MSLHFNGNAASVFRTSLMFGTGKPDTAMDEGLFQEGHIIPSGLHALKLLIG